LFSKKEDFVSDAEKFYDQYNNLIHDSEKVSFEMIDDLHIMSNYEEHYMNTNKSI
jgi:hypothetical protein